MSLPRAAMIVRGGGGGKQYDKDKGLKTKQVSSFSKMHAAFQTAKSFF
jgi:hypothetical protein